MHMFSKKLIVALNLHHPFVPDESTAWIFFIFWPSKICVSLTSVVFFFFPPRCHLSSSRRRHTATSCHASFPLSQDDLTASTSSFSNASSYRFASWAKTEPLNLLHHHRPPSPDRPTPTLHYYKKVILTLATLSTTQQRHPRDELADPLSLPKQLIAMWIHVKRYFEVP
jgi:hypothetical protein